MGSKPTRLTKQIPLIIPPALLDRLFCDLLDRPIVGLLFVWGQRGELALWMDLGPVKDLLDIAAPETVHIVDGHTRGGQLFGAYLRAIADSSGPERQLPYPRAERRD